MTPGAIRHRTLIMADFFQTGAVATLHRLGTPNVTRLERELAGFAEETPIALVLPCHVRELGTRIPGTQVTIEVGGGG